MRAATAGVLDNGLWDELFWRLGLGLVGSLSWLVTWLCISVHVCAGVRVCRETGCAGVLVRGMLQGPPFAYAELLVKLALPSLLAYALPESLRERIVASTQRVKRPAHLLTPGSGGCFGHVVNHKEKRQPGGRAGRGFHGTEIRLRGDRAARYPSSHQAQQRHVFVSLVIRFGSLSAAFRIQSPIFIHRHRRR